MTTQYPSSNPPGYSNSETRPLLVDSNDASLDQPTTPRSPDDNLPDDFKYNGFVSECELSVRQKFIRKVYTILSLQILITIIIASAFLFSQSLSQWALVNIWSFYVALVLTFVSMIAAFSRARNYPTNLMLLSLFTVSEAYTLGFVTALFNTTIVVQALSITIAVFVGLTLVAMFSEYDFTQWQGYAFAGILFLFGAGIVNWFVPFSSTMELIYSGTGALIFSVYILIDTQLIMQQFHPEDEIIAAIEIYLDVVNLFLYVLRILQETNDN